MFELSDISQVMGQNLGENLLPTKKNIRCEFFSSPTYGSYGGGRSRYSSSSGSGASNMFREMASSALADTQKALRRSQASYRLGGGDTSQSAITNKAWADYNALRRLAPYRSTLRQMGANVPRMNAPWGTLVGSAVQNPWMIGGFDTDSHYVHKRDYSKGIPQMPKLSKEYMSRYFGNLPSANIDHSYSNQLAKDRGMRTPSNIKGISSSLGNRFGDTGNGLYNRLMSGLSSDYGRGTKFGARSSSAGLGSRITSGLENLRQQPGFAGGMLRGASNLADLTTNAGSRLGLGSYNPSSQWDMFRMVAPMFGAGLGKGRLTPGKETTLDAIPHKLKGGGSISSSQANTFLREYSKPGRGRNEMVTSVVKNFLKTKPSAQQKIDFIRENF